MLLIPKRVSLISETASILRTGINEGHWKETLPGEHILCGQLQISRPTLRSALSLLQKEGMVRIAHGKRSKVFPVGKKRISIQRKTIGLVFNKPVEYLTQSNLQVIMDVRHHLYQGGFDSEIFIAPTQDFRYNRLKLENFIEKHAVFCCVLLSSSEEQQNWFYQKGIPALVLGSCYPSVDLPSMDVDHYALCRHAAGIFLSRGHRRLAIIRSDDRIAGYRASAEGFMDGITQSRHAKAKGIVVRHNDMRRDLIRKLDQLLESEGQRPTAILTSRPLETLMVVMHLLKRGLTIPDDISLISRDRDHYFDCLDLQISHYAYPEGLFSKRLTRLMLELLENGMINTHRNLILSEFQDGESLRSLDPEEE